MFFSCWGVSWNGGESQVKPINAALVFLLSQVLELMIKAEGTSHEALFVCSEVVEVVSLEEASDSFCLGITLVWVGELGGGNSVKLREPCFSD